MARKQYTPEETAAYNERKKAEMEEMFKKIDEGVKQVFESDKYREYLKFVSKFTNYSVNNTLLINLQMPDASLVAPFGKWQKMGRHVNKGEQGIRILAPVTYKTNEVLVYERPVKDEFGNQVYNEDGTEKTEQVEDPVRGLAFKDAYVFDVSQTSGKEIPSFVDELSGEMDEDKKDAIFKALKKVTGIDIEFENIRGSAKGYCSYKNNRIVVRDGMSDNQTLKTAFHEVAHKLLHDPENEIVTAKSPRNEKEIHAESVAFIVAERFGIDTSEYSFPYIASWSDGKQLEQLKNALQEIQAAAKKISAAIESELLKLQKRGLSMEEKLSDTELDNVQKAEFLIEDSIEHGASFSDDDIKKITDFAAEHEDIHETVRFVYDMENIQKQRDSYGYDFTHMKPFDTKKEALEAFDRGEAVFLLYPDNTEGMAESREEIESFDGYFGTEKEHGQETEKRREDDLLPVSKLTALEMFDKGLDVYIDNIPVENREQIENAPDGAALCLIEYQYAAELDFDDVPAKNVKNISDNIIGNTPYTELGEKSELKYYKLKSAHAVNVAKQLDEDGIRYSGVKKGRSTTLTINSADIPAYEEAVKKVIAVYEKNDAQKDASENAVSDKKSNIIGNTPFEELGKKSELVYYTNLKNRHANNIAKALDEHGIKFSGLVKGTVTTITINAADTAKYEAVVSLVKEGYSKAKENPAPAESVNNPEKQRGKDVSYKDIPICTMSLIEAKQSGSLDALRESIQTSKACVRYFEENIYKEYEARNIQGFISDLEEKFGLERTMYSLAATVQSLDFDGRFSKAVKERAAQFNFDSSGTREKIRTNTHSTVLNMFYEQLMEREKELQLSAPSEKKELSSDFDKKFLFSTEHVELHDDYRGIPETNYFTSSANEYYVDGIGWLNDGEYDREQKRSGQNAKDFYDRVVTINASYIDSDGMTGSRDMTAEEYRLMSDKTYSEENVEALAAAKAKFDERCKSYGVISEKPTEYYAVSMTSGRKYEITSISADGLVTVVQPNIATVAEAKKAMIELFERKKSDVKCQFIHPQTMDEKSAEIYKNQSKELPELSYRIKLNTDKKAAPDNTHYVQQYVKNPDDTYSLGDIIARGDYDKCNVELAKAMQMYDTKEKYAALGEVSAPVAEKQPDFEIYQLKRDESTHLYRFEPIERLVEFGLKPEFKNYEKVYQGSLADIPDAGEDVCRTLDGIFTKFNIDRPEDFKGHSLSVSDVIMLKDKAYYVDSAGFQPLRYFKSEEKSLGQDKAEAAPETEKVKQNKKKKL